VSFAVLIPGELLVFQWQRRALILSVDTLIVEGLDLHDDIMPKAPVVTVSAVINGNPQNLPIA
jgi:hypothetical protein